jgi:hypothetical protein
MNIPILNKMVDERFLNHRLRSTSLAGIVSSLVAIGLWSYRFYIDHVWSWDLLAIPLTFVTLKLALLAWFRFTD